MEYWMGQATKKQIAEKLNLPPIRIWQLSQQATCGMVVGLLTQPKTRSQMKNSCLDPLNDPKLLHAQITKLEKQVATQQRLIEWLREMPSYEAMKLMKETQERLLEVQAQAPSAKAPSQEEMISDQNAKTARKAQARSPGKKT
jgi:hypothetical protein